MLAVLYDIHGNLPALEAVLAETEDAGVDRFLLGGDYGTPSPAPHETLARLRELPAATWIRGNGERWLREPPEIPEVIQVYEEFEGVLTDEEIDRLYGLPVSAELDGVLYVHGSPLSDIESFAPQPQEGEERMLGGVRDRTIVFGHSHQQFRRPGPDGTDLVNPEVSGCRSTATSALRGRHGTVTSSSGGRSTTSSGLRPPSARWAASSASSPQTGS